MKKKELKNVLKLKKSKVSSLDSANVLGGRVETLQRTCVSYPNRCSINECQYTDVTCMHTETCQEPKGN